MAGLATASGSFFLSLCVCVGGGQYFCIFLNSNSHLLFPTFFLPRYLYPFSSSRFAICAFLNVSFLRLLDFPPPFLRRTMPSFFVCFLLCFLLCSLLGTCRSAKGSTNIQGGLVSSPSPFLQAKAPATIGFAFSDEGVCSFLRASTPMMTTRSSTDKWLTKQEI